MFELSDASSLNTMNDSRKKLGLALGSGSARGFAHIGILRVLRDEGLPVDCIAGTSMGAIVGAVYAAGALPQVEAMLEKFDWKNMAGLLDPQIPVSGVFGGRQIEKLLRTLLGDKRIEDFSIPFAAIAADVATGKEVIFTSGDAIKAVRASMSIPGIFTPVLHDNRFLVDGGIVTPVPVRAARMLGADVVIAVNLAAEMSKRSYIKPPEQDDAVSSANSPETANSLRTMETALRPFLQDALQKGRSFIGKPAQVMEEWFDEKVERGREVLEEKAPFLSDWVKKDDSDSELPDMFRVIFNSINIMQGYLAEANFAQSPPDILLVPDLAEIRLIDFNKPQECIRKGEDVAREMLPQIRAALEI